MSKKKNRSGKKRNRAGRKNQLRRLKRTVTDKPADSSSEILEPTHNHIDLEYEELFRSYNPSLNNNNEYSLIAITYQNASQGGRSATKLIFESLELALEQPPGR